MIPPPTPEEIERIAHDPEWALEAIQRWGVERLMHPYQQAPAKVGLGDLVKRLTSLIGIKPCSACEERARKLNRVQLPTRKPCGCQEKRQK